MKKLYIDEFVRKEGFNSTEEYIESCLEEGRKPHFDKVEYFKDLYDKGLIRENIIIRTSDKGIIDRHYFVDEEGNLVGVDQGPYPGEKGIFKPEDILIGKRISDGWTIESTTFEILFYKFKNLI